MFGKLFNLVRPKAPIAELVDLRSIPVALLMEPLRALPDPRLTDHPQRKVIHVPEIGAVRIWFERVPGDGARPPYWKFVKAVRVPVDLFEDSLVDQRELKPH